MTPVMRLNLRPDWANVEAVGENATAFLRAHRLHDEAVSAVAMVTCELTENAAKYGAFGDHDEIEVAVIVGERMVTVEVRNRVSHADVDNLSRLDGMIQWIRGYQDPFEAYAERLKEVSAQTLDSSESGLGLTRIAYEGRAILDFFINDRNVLAVSAIHHM